MADDLIAAIAEHIRSRFNLRLQIDYGSAPMTTSTPFKTMYANCAYLGTAQRGCICRLTIENENLVVTCARYKTADHRDVHAIISLADPDSLERLIDAIKHRLYSDDWPPDYMTSRRSTERP